jgi:hypothetical protein
MRSVRAIVSNAFGYVIPRNRCGRRIDRCLFPKLPEASSNPGSGGNMKFRLWFTITLLLSVFAIAGCAEAPSDSPRFTELTVERLNIVSPGGTKRIVLSNQERLPKPVVGGREHVRYVKAAGMLFYNEAGDEVGGLAVARVPDGQSQVALVLDYATAEAAAFLRRAQKEGYEAALN